MMPLRALVVGHNQQTQGGVVDILGTYGFECVVANDSIAALHHATPDQIDLIVAELDMPRLDGSELRLFQSGAFGDTPPPNIVSSATMDDARSAQHQDLLLSVARIRQPFGADDVIAAVATVFGER